MDGRLRIAICVRAITENQAKKSYFLKAQKVISDCKSQVPNLRLN